MTYLTLDESDWYDGVMTPTDGVYMDRQEIQALHALMCAASGLIYVQMVHLPITSTDHEMVAGWMQRISAVGQEMYAETLKRQ